MPRKPPLPDEEIHWKEEIATAIEGARAEGLSELHEIVPFTRGADPRAVESVLANVPARPSGEAVDVSSETSRARRATSEFFLKLPAADPMSSQWWFTLDTVQDLARRVAQEAGPGEVAFLGTPTVAHFYRFRYKVGLCFDHDPDVVAALNREAERSAKLWDVSTGAHRSHPRFVAAVADPPWYPPMIDAFIAAAARLVPSGFIFCSIPSRLTRPGVVRERNSLIDRLRSVGVEVVGIDLDAVEYNVPGFESAAFKNLKGFSGRPWRKGDLLVLRTSKRTKALSWAERPRGMRVHRFSRGHTRFRMFVAPRRAVPSHSSEPVRIEKFETYISTRNFDINSITVWSSDRRAASVSKPDYALAALQVWARGESQESARRAVRKSGASEEEARKFVDGFQALFRLWSSNAVGRILRPDEIKRRSRNGPLAATPSLREHRSSPDGFRPEFPRDRDRVLWSSGLKRLANKTQVFAFDEDDNVRQRLAHSVEVMQLASTIGASFGLDMDLIEAGALAHDIGHTPFGHGGEFALDAILEELVPDTGGFNHYEHGVDIVRWLEDVYRSPSSDGHPGLNLTPEVAECIFKHTYCREGKQLCQAELYRRSKHADLFQDDACHLEGQAVRLADKISYMISDLEDGIRLGVFNPDHIAQCRLFLRPPIDMKLAPGETLLERFIAQRRVIIKVLMEDVLPETERRLLNLAHGKSLRSTDGYSVEHSPEMKADVNEVWQRLQKGVLHKHPMVKSANLRAARIVSELFYLFSSVPSLIESSFQRSHEWLWTKRYMDEYRKRFGTRVRIPKRHLGHLHLGHLIDFKWNGFSDLVIPTEHFVLAKDYVASLTDAGARRLHQRLLSSKAL